MHTAQDNDKKCNYTLHQQQAQQHLLYRHDFVQRFRTLLLIPPRHTYRIVQESPDVCCNLIFLKLIMRAKYQVKRLLQLLLFAGCSVLL